MSQLTKYVGNIAQLEKIADFQAVLNKKPNPKWIKKHPFAKNVNYIEIGTVEALMEYCFPKRYYEVKETKQLFNAICVTVRVHYFHPVTEEWMYMDGVGAQSVQVDKGSSASDLGAIKADAVMKAAPAAESYAIKDACEKIGEIFGRSINRKDVFSFPSAYKQVDKEVERVKDQLSKCKTIEDVDMLQSLIEDGEAMTEQIADLLKDTKNKLAK